MYLDIIAHFLTKNFFSPYFHSFNKSFERAIFDHLQALGNVEQQEMLRTFNMGIGLICVVPGEKYKRAKTLLDRANEPHAVIGKIIKGDRRVLYN